jgi:tetratricopeptide (TPR) repeat protein/thiol-disulfide isomerase/thioredoxin
LLALAKTAKVHELGPISLQLLGTGLFNAGDSHGAETVLRRAQGRHPRDVWVNYELARVLVRLSRSDEAIRFYTVARAIRPETAHVLAHLLEGSGKGEEAIAVLRELERLRPDDGRHLACLGLSLQSRGRAAEAKDVLARAEAALRAWIRLHPDDAKAHASLGNALRVLGKLDDAIAECRAVIRLWPGHAHAYSALGRALAGQGKLDDAIAAYHTAIRLEHNDAAAHSNLGIALARQGKAAEAISEFREATRLQPDHPWAHYHLGNALKDQGKLEEAIVEYRIAIRLKPDYAEAHYDLGNALKDQGKRDEAIVKYRTAIRLEPDYAEALCNLGIFLQQQGAYTESLEMLRKGHEIGSRRPDWHYPSAQWVAEAERASGLADRLTAVLQGEDHPNGNAERLGFARLASNKKLYAAAARLWAETLVSDPQLGDDSRSEHRYQAACAAVLAGTGRGQDHPPLDGAAKAALRGQARDWLKAELAAWTKLLESGPPQARSDVVQTLQHWTRVSDLAGIREADALTRLPADEQIAWRTLWAEVDALRQRAGGQETAAAPPIGAVAAPRGQRLGVGDPAPKLDVKSFVKGEPIPTLEPGKLYVVEFWATWCGPCRVSIPHLTELQRKYKDKGVTFLGVSVWEHDQDAVVPFVKSMGDKMEYSVAMDQVPEGEKGKMAETWMEAAGQSGIPTAFIVREGKIAWIGHPMQLDQALAKTSAKEFDIQAAARQPREKKAAIANEPHVGHDVLVALTSAARQAWFGQKKDYSATCVRVLNLAKDTKDPLIAERAAKLCSLRPSDDKTHEAALVLARSAVELGGEWHDMLFYLMMALGMAEYRCGHYQEADAALFAASQLGEQNYHVTVTTAFYRAMSLFKLGKEAEARKLASEAVAKMKPLPANEKNPLTGNANADDLILWMAYKEANALLGLTR